MFCLIFMTVPLVPFSILGYIFAPKIVGIFHSGNAEFMRIGTQAFRYQSFSVPLTGWIMLNSMTTQSMGKATKASILAIARQGLFLLPLLFILTPLWGLRGLFMSQPLADVCTFLLTIPISLSVFRDMKTDKQTLWLRMVAPSMQHFFV